jgi:hypothetical protein
MANAAIHIQEGFAIRHAFGKLCSLAKVHGEIGFMNACFVTICAFPEIAFH